MKPTHTYRIRQTLRTILQSAAAAGNRLYSRFEHCTEQHPLLTPASLALILNLIIEMLGRRSVIDGIAHLLLHPHAHIRQPLDVIYFQHRDFRPHRGAGVDGRDGITFHYLFSSGRLAAATD